MLAEFMGQDTPEIRARFVASIPLGRLSLPSDIATAAVFFASDEAAFITGARSRSTAVAASERGATRWVRAAVLGRPASPTARARCPAAHPEGFVRDRGQGRPGR